MATLFWVGGTGTYDGTTNHFATTSGGAASVALPTSADDVTFDTASNATAYTVTISATLNCNNLIIGNPASGVITFAGASAINVFGNFQLATGMTRTYTGTITFSATATGKTITSNSVLLSSAVTFDGVGGGWTLQDNFSVQGGQNITLTNGSLDTNGKTVTCKGFLSNNSNTRTLTLGASTINVTPSSGTAAWNLSTITGLTFNANTSTISLTSTAAYTFFGGGLTYNNVTFTTTTTSLSITGINTFSNLSITGDVAKTDVIAFNASQTITVTLTINGNSSTNRIWVTSGTQGTPVTLTAAAVSISNADFRDITGAGAGSWNLAAITGLSGDCGGNSGITFTTAADQHWLNASSASWSTASNWTSRVPLPQDNVFMDKAFGTSQVVTMDMPRVGKTVDFTGATWTTGLTFLRSATPAVFFGSLILISGLSFSGGTNSITMAGRGSYTIKTFGITIDSPITLDAFGGTLTLDGDLTMGTTRTLTLTAGTFTTNNYNITAGGMTRSGSVTLTINMGSSLWTMAGSSNQWTMVASGTTLNPGTSTIKMTDTGAGGRTFTGAGLTYYNIWFSGGGSTANISVTGSNTFNDFKDDGTAAHSIIFTQTQTQHVSTFSVKGNGAGNEITLNSTTTVAFNLIKDGSGVVYCDYLNLQHSVATPANVWYAGENSINNQGTATAGSGWIFSASSGNARRAFYRNLKPRPFAPGLAR